MPIAAATTQSVKSSREPVRATCISSQGKARRPTPSIRATKSATFPKVMASCVPKPRPAGSAGAASAPSTNASGGSRTRTSTMIMSSTTSQPSAIFPVSDCNVPSASSARSSTTVLATDSDRPKMRPAPKSHPHQIASAIDIAVPMRMRSTAPVTAMARTLSRSSSER